MFLLSFFSIDMYSFNIKKLGYDVLFWYPLFQKLRIWVFCQDSIFFKNMVFTYDIWYYDNLTIYLLLDIYIVSNFFYYKYCCNEYPCI